MKPEIKEYAEGRWFISKTSPSGVHSYFHKDGHWRDRCNANGWYKSKKEAQRVIKPNTKFKVGDVVRIVDIEEQDLSHPTESRLIVNGDILTVTSAKDAEYNYNGWQLIAFAHSTAMFASGNFIFSWRAELVGSGEIPEQMFCNYYICDDCNNEWESEWDCECDDKCPSCNKSYTPYQSEDITGQI